MSFSQRLLLVLIFPVVSSLILPLTKPSGELDFNSIINHVTLMEQTIASLQTQVQATTTEMATVKVKLQAAESELKSSRDEISAVKTELRMSETDIALLKHDLQNSPGPTEFANLKTELEVLKVSYQTLVQHMNFTVLDDDIKFNMKELKSLKSELVTTKRTINATTFDLKATNSDVCNLAAQIHETNSKLNQTLHDVQITAQNTSVLDSQLTDIKNSINSTDSKLQVVETELSAVKAEYNSIKYRQNITEQELTVTDNRSQSTASGVKLLQTRVHAISGDVDVLNKEISDIKHKTGHTVSFQATHGSPNLLPNSTTLKFEQVNNNGGCYNVTSGIFTAPVAGTYIFWGNVVFYGLVGDHHIYIYNGLKLLAVGFGRLESSDYYSQSSAMVVTRLEAGDQVYTHTDTASNYIAGYSVSSYGGALLYTS